MRKRPKASPGESGIAELHHPRCAWRARCTLPGVDVRQVIAWWRALRAFSFTIAIVSCVLGVVLAWCDGAFRAWDAILVVVAGVLFQAGVNLINDFFEYKHGQTDHKNRELGVFGAARSKLEWSIFGGGLACLALIGPIGVHLALRVGWPLFALGVLGVFAAYGYTGEPFNYKRRGLATVLVFFLMGVFMIAGSHLAIAGRLSWQAVLVSLPVSALVSLLLLSNELRDFEDDARLGIRTLTVRVGYARGVAIYWALLAFAYASAIALWLLGLAPHGWLVLLSLPALRAPIALLHARREARRPLTPLTARLHLVFGALWILGFALSATMR